MRKEIEVKAKVDDLEVRARKLESRGCTFSDPITQKDYVFTAPDVSYEDMKIGDIFLRVRETSRGSYFTLKQAQKYKLDNREEETEISDPESMKSALEIMGYTLAVKIFKTRRTATYSGLEISLDEVDDLGSFVEVEKMTDDSVNAEVVQVHLLDFLEQCGVHKQKRELNGYDTLIYFKQKEGAQ